MSKIKPVLRKLEETKGLIVDEITVSYHMFAIKFTDGSAACFRAYKDEEEGHPALYAARNMLEKENVNLADVKDEVEKAIAGFRSVSQIAAANDGIALSDFRMLNLISEQEYREELNRLANRDKINRRKHRKQLYEELKKEFEK